MIIFTVILRRPQVPVSPVVFRPGSLHLHSMQPRLYPKQYFKSKLTVGWIEYPFCLCHNYRFDCCFKFDNTNLFRFAFDKLVLYKRLVVTSGLVLRFRQPEKYKDYRNALPKAEANAYAFYGAYNMPSDQCIMSWIFR